MDNSPADNANLPLVPLLRQLSSAARQGEIDAAAKRSLKLLLLSGDSSQISDAAKQINALGFDFKEGTENKTTVSSDSNLTAEVTAGLEKFNALQSQLKDMKNQSQLSKSEQK